MSLASLSMLMVQYQFHLPADYPMRNVRARIAARGPQFDSLIWLALDPARWMLSCHQLWWSEQAPPARHATLYEVAHFSQPQ